MHGVTPNCRCKARSTLTSASSLSTVFEGRAPTPSQYRIRLTLHSTVFVVSPGVMRGLNLPKVSIGFALRPRVPCMATMWKTRL